MSYVAKNELLNGASQAVTASQTAKVVSNVFRITAQDSLNFLCRVKAASTTVAAAITAKLQESWDGTNWEAVGNRAQVSITADGTFEISLVATDTSDAAQLPLWPQARVVIDTGAGDAVTITEVWVTKRL